MTATKPETMTIDQLVERFSALALDQDRAMLRSEIAKVNQLYDELKAVGMELKRRNDDQRRALLPLHSHPNPQVRLKSAITTLAVAPEASRQVLQLISDRNEYPQAAYAREMMRSLDRGSFIPT